MYLAVANARTPTLDAELTRLSNTANRSRLWLATAAGLAILGGRRQRRAAALGVAAIGLTSAAINLVIKPVLRRARPDRVGAAVPDPRQVRIPMSHSFPSRHAASASAFATTVGHELPVTALPLRLPAVGVAYSRVHTGRALPGDVVAGSVIGAICGTAIGAAASRKAGHPAGTQRRGRATHPR